MDDDNEKENYYVVNSDQEVGNSTLLYATARRSPQSLIYYGFCLENGNYTVKLHFAEIVLTDEEAYNSVGRRIFNTYIQVYPLESAFFSENILEFTRFCCRKSNIFILRFFLTTKSVAT